MQPQLEFGSTAAAPQDAPVRVCERLPLGAIELFEPRLATILNWWDDARARRRWPSWSQIDVGAIRQLADRVTAVQVIATQMYRYSFVELIGSAEPQTQIAKALELQTRDELQSVASLGTPRLDQIRVAAEVNQSVQRLMLPLSRDRVTINQILICRADC
jgi:hypothetical protein